MASIHEVVEWAKSAGEAKIIDRLNMILLPDLLAEGVRLTELTPGSACSAELLIKVRRTAESLVGSPYTSCNAVSDTTLQLEGEARL